MCRHAYGYEHVVDMLRARVFDLFSVFSVGTCRFMHASWYMHADIHIPISVQSSWRGTPGHELHLFALLICLRAYPFAYTHVCVGLCVCMLHTYTKSHAFPLSGNHG